MVKTTARTWLLGFALLAGCALVRVDYFQPVDPPGVLKGGPCGSGPKDHVILEFGEVTLEVAVIKSHLQPELMVGFDIPQGHSITLLENTVLVNGKPHVFDAVKTRDRKTGTVTEVDRVLIGSGEKRFRWIVSDLSDLPAHFVIELPLEPASDEFHIRLMPMQLDGGAVPLPEMTFRKASGVFSTPINC